MVIGIVAVAGAYVWSLRAGKHPVSLSAGMTANSAAYDAYMRGKVKVTSENAENNEAAIKLFEQAVAADPNFAAAYAELARAYAIKARFFAPVAEMSKFNEDAEVAVEKSARSRSQSGGGPFCPRLNSMDSVQTISSRAGCSILSPCDRIEP